MRVVQSIKLLLAVMVMTIVAGSAFAQVPAARVPQFVPIDTWNVQQTTLSQVRGLDGVKLPCMMAAGYDNGYIVRLSGGGHNMLAMAIDFRQSAFKQGRQYSATVTVDGAYTQPAYATAFSDSVLIFNLRTLSGFYQILHQGSVMELAIEGNVMSFNLGNIAQGIDEMESCFGGEPMMAPSPMAPPQAMPTPMMHNASMPPPMAPDGSMPTPMMRGAPMPMAKGSMPAPRAPDEQPSSVRWNQKVTPKPAMMGSNVTPPHQTGMVWEANAGDGIRETLEKWSSVAGVQLDWQAAGNSGFVANDLRVRGSFEDAVQNLMAQNSAAMGIDAHMMGSGAPMAGAPSGYGGYPYPMASPPMSGGASYDLLPGSATMGGPLVEPPEVGAPGMWNAPAGSNLQQVLRIWSQQAGVNFSWQSHTGFAVKSAVSANGSYEDALQILMQQYANDRGLRPVVRLNNDPVTGERFLFVESTRI